MNSDHRKLIEKIAKKHGFQEFDVTIKEGSKKGENFLGNIQRVTIEADKQKLIFILKMVPEADSQSKFQPRPIYLREIFVYQNIFDEFAVFQEEHNISNRFQAHPKLLEKCDKEKCEALMLEDMTVKGFKMCDKKITMNSFHIQAVLEEYAKFHSVSFAMRDKDPNRFNELTKNLKDVFALDDETQDIDRSVMMKAAFTSLYKSVEDDPLATQALKEFEKQLVDAPKKPNPNDLLVVTHGDSWCNNFLFKYKDEEHDKPSDVCIIDWQLSKLGSPGMDLCYLLLANGSKEILEDYKTYLKFYYDVFSKNLAEFGCDPDEIFPYESLESHFIKFCPMYIFYCLAVMRILVCKPEEAPHLENIKSDSNMENVFNFTLSNMDEYYQRLACIVKFMTKYNLLNIVK